MKIVQHQQFLALDKKKAIAQQKIIKPINSPTVLCRAVQIGFNQ
jgi:hypothetical protein